MRQIPLVILMLAAALTGCSSASRVAQSACGDLGPRGQVRAQLRVLDCLTAIAAVDPQRREGLRERIERGFGAVYQDLMTQPMRQEEASAWTELYRYSTRFYPRLTKLQGPDGIPFAFVNAHHFSVPFWIRRSVETKLGTLVHFDTHSDMEAIPRPDDVRWAVRNIKAGRKLKRSWHVIAHAVYRNSMPVTAAVLGAGVNEVIWAKPQWTPAPIDFLSHEFFLARPKKMGDPRSVESLLEKGPYVLEAAYRAQTSDFFQVYYDPADNNGVWLPRRLTEVEAWEPVAPTKRPHEKYFDGIERIRFSILTADRAGPGAERLPGAISGKRFVLDIDLDYFANIGSNVEVTDDYPSHGQRYANRRDQPDSTLAIYRNHLLNATVIAAEREIIERRIRRFRHLLLSLRRAGKRPSIVTIADSTNIPFSSYRQGQEHASFVPSHHSYWVHRRVVSVIREVYGNGPVAAAAGPTGPPVPPEPTRGKPVLPRSNPASLLVQPIVRAALTNALCWATGAANSFKGSDHLSAYLLIIHAIATYGPDADLRRAARAAARVLTAGILTPSTLGPELVADEDDIHESLRRIHFARRYGGTEAELALAAARWSMRSLKLKKEPNIDLETRPLPPSAALNLLGLRRAASGEEPNLTDVILAFQATDGGFGTAEVPKVDRALVSLAAVRGLLGMVPTADLPPPSRKPLWKGYPISQGQLDDSVLRATLFAVAVLGEQPSLTDAGDGVLLYRSVVRMRGHDAARLVADAAGKLLSGRIAVKLPEMIKDAASPEEMISLTESARAMKTFGADVSAVGKSIQQRLLAVGRRKVLGIKSRGKLTPAEVFQSVARSYALEAMGVTAIPYLDTVREALPITANLHFTTDSDALIDRFNAVAHLLLTASGNRRVHLDRKMFPGEWTFLNDVTVEVLASRRPDMASALLESLRILGEDEKTQRVRNLIWQLVTDQNKDGSWGRRSEKRLRPTWAALSALGDFPPKPSTDLIRRTLALVARRAPPAKRTAPSHAPGYRPGLVMGTRLRGRGMKAALPTPPPLPPSRRK